MCEALPPTLERIVRIYLPWYLGIEALCCKNDPFWGTYSDHGKGTSGTGGPRARRILILWDLVGGLLGCHAGYIGQPGCRLAALLVPRVALIGALGGFMRDLGYQNIDILVALALRKHG